MPESDHEVPHSLAPISSHVDVHPVVTVDILPSEILSNALVIAYASRSDDESINFELLVSHVSRRWRAVALDTQELWGVISMSMPLDRVAAYVDRSKAYTLSITMFPNAPDGVLIDPRFSESADRFLQVIEPASSRWRRLFISTNDHEQMKLVLDRVFSHRAPQLESFQVLQDTNDAPADPIVSGESFEHFFSHAHTIAIVRFYLVHMPWASFPAINLREMSIGGLSLHLRMNYAQLRQAVGASRSLVELTLIGAFPNVESHVAHTPIVLPALKILRVASLDPEDTDFAVFHLLSTPSLKSLEIGGLADLNAFISDINTSPPKYSLVTSLQLGHISGHLERDDIFSAFPMISYFSVSGSMTYGLFSSWSCRVLRLDRSFLWPDLHTLVIDMETSSAFAMTGIIQKRKKWGRPLTTLRVTEAWWDRCSARIRRWLNEQLTVEIIRDGGLSSGVSEEDMQEREDPQGKEHDFDPDQDRYDPSDPAHIQRDLDFMAAHAETNSDQTYDV